MVHVNFNYILYSKLKKSDSAIPKLLITALSIYLILVTANPFYFGMGRGGGVLQSRIVEAGCLPSEICPPSKKIVL